MWHTNLEDMRQGRDMSKWRKSFKKLELEGRSQIAGPKYIVAVTHEEWNNTSQFMPENWNLQEDWKYIRGVVKTIW